MLKSFQAGSRRGVNDPRRVQSGLRTGLLAVAIAAGSMLHSSVAAALGLGDITLHSAMGQPFSADIELVEAGGLGPEDIAVALANAEAFAKAGVERVFFLNDLRFTPVVRGNRAVVRVESRKAVTEPYLDFVLRLARPNGDQFREYTVLLDPPDSAAGLAATRSRNQSATATAKPDASRLPVAPPKAVQGKRWTVSAGDTLAAIARRVQAPGSKISSNELSKGIVALNPQAFPQGERSQLKVGQSLLLPDTAAEPRVSPPSTSSAAVAPPAETGFAPVAPTAANAAEQLTVTALENQQLSKAVDDLKGQVQQVTEDEAGKDKRIIELQTQLAEMKALATRPAPAVANVAAAQTPAAVAPAAVPVVAPSQPVEEEGLPWTEMLAALLVLLLLLALAWSVRRNKLKNQTAFEFVPEPTPDDVLVKPAQSPVTPVFEVPPVSPRPATPVVTNTGGSSGQRLAGASTDALDGASIYIAYGRFAEALAILREALVKQPQRTDVRMRVLELLGEQGDVEGFDAEEKVLLNHGVELHTLEEVRARYPKLTANAASTVPSNVAGSTAAVSPSSDASPGLASGAAVITGAAVVAATVAAEKNSGQLDENAAASLNPEPVDDFQLNLDDLSMDADWDLVDPFDAAPTRKPAVEPEPLLDPSFSSNLTELPEVFEMPEEQFLSDFAEEELPADLDMQFDLEPEPVAQAESDMIEEAFLDSFMTDDTEFDLMTLEEEPLSKINEAQVLIDDGDIEQARLLLQEVIDESDEGQQQTARDLLAGLD